MSRLVAISIYVASWWAFSPACSAEPAAAGDSCDVIGTQGIRPPAARVEVQREAATKIVVHIKRACDLIATLEKDHPEPAVTGPLTTVAAELNALVLAPIYREYPELRGLTAAEALPKTPKPAPGARPVMGAATATYLRWALSNIQHNATRVPSDLCEKAGMPCLRPIIDLSSEISFAEAPVYVGYPRLFVLDMKETDRRSEGRTAKSDANFRKASPQPGAVSVSPAALKVVRDYLESLRKEADERCEIATFMWTLGGESKGPDDAAWKPSPPGVGLGSYPCRQLPPDVVRRIGGLPIAFFADKPNRFVDKIVDHENGKFVLKDRGAAPVH